MFRLILGVMIPFALFAGLDAGDGPNPQPAKNERTGPRLDADGYPLPEAASARLGSLRGVEREPIDALAISADGQRVATYAGQKNPELHIWEAPTGKLLHTIPLKIKTHEIASSSVLESPRISSLAFSPDLRKVAWADEDGGFHVRDTISGKDVLLHPQPGFYGDFQFSADGNKLAVKVLSPLITERRGDKTSLLGVDAFRVELWDLEANSASLLWKAADGPAYRQLAFSPDFRWAAYILKKDPPKGANSTQQQLVLADAATREKLSSIDLRGDSTCQIDFDPTGRLLALAEEGSLRLFEVPSGRERWKASYPDGVLRLVVRAPDYLTQYLRQPKGLFWLGGSEVGVQFDARTLMTWSLKDGRRGETYDYQVGDQFAFAVAPLLVFTEGGHTLQFWDTDAGNLVGNFSAHRLPPNVLFRDDGSLITWDDTKICHWEAGSWKLLRSFPFREADQKFFFDPRQSYFLRGVAKTLMQYDLASGRLLHQWSLEMRIATGVYHPGAKTFINGVHAPGVGGKPKAAKRTQALEIIGVVSAETRQLTRPYRPVDAFPFADTASLALVNRDTEVTSLDLLDLNTGNFRGLALLPGQAPAVIGYSIPGRELLCTLEVEADKPGTVPGLVIDAATGDSAPRRLPARMSNPVLTPDGRFLIYLPAAMTYLGAAREPLPLRMASKEIAVWEIAAGQERGRLRGDFGDIEALAISPDGRYLASGHADTTILIWDLRRPFHNGQEATPLQSEPQHLWNDLLTADAGRADAAIWALVRQPRKAMPYLTEKLKPAARPANLEDWIRKLDSEVYSEREQASQAVKEMGRAVIPDLEKRLADPKLSLEARTRLQALARRPAPWTITPERLAQKRALEALEYINNPDSRALLHRLAAGASGAFITEEAVAVLKRSPQ